MATDQASGWVRCAVLFAASVIGLSSCSLPSAGPPAVGGGLLSLPDAADIPTWAPDESWMAYRADDGDSFTNRSLRLVSLDGASTVSLGRASEPLWFAGEAGESVSPSGRHIAYVLDRGDDASGPYELWLSTIDGRERHKVANGVRSHGWSSDGTQLAFGTRQSDEAEHLWILAVGDQRAGTSVQIAGGVHEWEWSPDGSRIAYTSAQKTLWVTTRTGPPRKLVAGHIWSWKWSPDSTRLGYESDGLWTISVGGSADDPDDEPVRVGPMVRDWHWEWSPDGRWMIYLIEEQGALHLVGHLWVASPDGIINELLASDTSMYSVRWSPSGDRLAFIVDDGGEDGSSTSWGADDGDLWVYTVSDGEREWVAGDVSRSDWSPDGEMLAYSVTGPAVDSYHGVYASSPLWVWTAGVNEPDRLVADYVKYSRWSPANSGIAYWRWPEADDPGGELWLWSEITNATGRAATRVHTGQPDSTAISTGAQSWGWSPTGTYLAYRTVEGGVSILESSQIELDHRVPADREVSVPH